jgi:dihydrolipoamide dehydrogenase
MDPPYVRPHVRRMRQDGGVRDPGVALPPDPDRRLREDAGDIVIIGGGPGGYEAALTAARHGERVTLIEERGLGGATVLTDVVPSKTLIATADVLDLVADSGALGIRTGSPGGPGMGALGVDLGAVNARVRDLAAAQSTDIRQVLGEAGVRILDGRGDLLEQGTLDPFERARGRHAVRHLGADGSVREVLTADVVLIATGARPRRLEGTENDGTRILDWTQLYDLEELPEHLIVVGSGVTGAEFASAYRALGSEVTLVSSRDRVLPGSDADAARVLEAAFSRRGIHVRSRSRAAGAHRTEDGVVVDLLDGAQIHGSHVLLAVGAIPSTAGLGLEQVGVRLRGSGHVETDRVSRTSVRGIYAAGDCTGVHPLASVAAMQGRIAMHHALGEAVTPLIAAHVSSAFTAPEVAAVGVGEQEAADEGLDVDVRVLPLATNPRAKMQGVDQGFVKLLVRPGSHTVLGGVVVAPRASELVHAITLAVTQRLSADDLAAAFTVYPSISGSIAEVARLPRE